MSKSQPPKPVYVLYGGDGFLTDENRRKIISELIGDADPQLCIGTFDSEAELSVVLDELRTLPFLAPLRLVVLRDADDFVSKHRDALENYLDSPSETASLIIIVSSWPTNTRLYKKVAKVGIAIDCKSPDKNALPAWIRSATTARGKKITAQAAEMLAEFVGADLIALDGEIEKLSTYAADRDTIAPDDVLALVTATAGSEAFALSNAITLGNVPAALKALGGMLTARGEEFRVLGQIAWHLRRAMEASQQLALGKTPSLKMPYSQQVPFMTMLKRRPLAKLQADFRKLTRADIAMKSGTDAKGALQDLVVSLCT